MARDGNSDNRMLKEKLGAFTVQLIFFLLSGLFALGVYAKTMETLEQRVTKLEEAQGNQSTVLCMLALEVLGDDKEKRMKILKICKGGNL